MTERVHASKDPLATYVFAVCRTLDAAALAELAGLSDAPVRTLAFGGDLTALVESVPAVEFTDEAWQKRLSDPQELERCARAHHTVVSAAADSGPTVPLPLATLYRGDERARQALTAEKERFHGALARIAHHAEWGVKVYAARAPGDPTDTGARPATAPTGEPPVRTTRPAAGAGLAYLERKRGIQQRQERCREETLRVAEEVDAEVRSIASDFRRLRPHGFEVTGEGRTQVLNATYLVAEQHAQDLKALAQALRDRTGAQIEVSGPWVPYSFVGEV